MVNPNQCLCCLPGIWPWVTYKSVHVFLPARVLGGRVGWSSEINAILHCEPEPTLQNQPKKLWGESSMWPWRLTIWLVWANGNNHYTCTVKWYIYLFQPRVCKTSNIFAFSNKGSHIMNNLIFFGIINSFSRYFFVINDKYQIPNKTNNKWYNHQGQIRYGTDFSRHRIKKSRSVLSLLTFSVLHSNKHISPNTLESHGYV